MVELEALRRLSARVGADPLLVQAAGGNTSLKHNGLMWIKASGTWLRDAVAKNIFVAVDHQRLTAALARHDAACESCVDFAQAGATLRPSIETTVHALMPQPVVVHVHCVNTIAWAIQANAEAALGVLLQRFNWAFIPYARPGLPLAGAIAQRLRPETDVLVLGNHGLVVAAQTVAEAEALLDRVVARLQRPARPTVAPRLETIRALCAGTDYSPAASAETHALATDAHALAIGGHAVYYPDHVVFLGVGVATAMASGAALVALPGKGVVVRNDAKPAVEPMGRCLADVMRRIGTADQLRALSESDIDRLVSWDAEIYRQTLTQTASGPERV